MDKETFVKIMMRNEEFKRAEKRRELILKQKKIDTDYTDFTVGIRIKEKKKRK